MRLKLPLALATAGLAAASSLLACSQSATPDADESRVEDAEDLYGKTEALDVTLSAPMTTLFERFKANKADPPKPLDDGGAPVGVQPLEFSEAGKLTFKVGASEKTVDLRVYVRGESSKHDCPFTKLKLDFSDKDQLKGTPFKGHGKVRLNTHCGPGDKDARSGMGRVMNGVGPVREELAYRVIRSAGIPTYLTRVLHIVYVDSAAKDAKTDTFAMAMESGDDAAQRFVKEKRISAESVYLDPASGDITGTITKENEGEITVGEALAGNGDWFAGGTHNLDSFGVPKAASVFKIPEDFDLTSIVLGDKAGWWGKGIEGAKAGLTTPEAVKKYLAQKSAMLEALDTAEKDAIAAKAVEVKDGKTTDSGFVEARKRVDQFFALPELAGK